MEVALPQPKRAFRIEEFAHRNSISRAQVYVELKAGRLSDLPRGRRLRRTADFGKVERQGARASGVFVTAVALVRARWISAI